MENRSVRRNYRLLGFSVSTNDLCQRVRRDGVNQPRRPIQRIDTNHRSSTAGDVTVPAGVYGILLTIILYPITVILGFVGIAKRNAALAAGILGIICWIGSILALSGLQALQYTGIGIYIGFVGAIILIIAAAMKTGGTPPRAAPTAPTAQTPPPPPPVPP